MTFTQSISTCFRKYFTFSGRAGRSEFWWFMLFLAIGAGITVYLDTVLSKGSFGENEIASTLFDLITFFPSLTVIFRRMHDISKSGWWLIPMNLIPGLGVLVIATSGVFNPIEQLSPLFPDLFYTKFYAGFGVALLIFGACWAIFWFARKSDAGDNRFGASLSNHSS